MHLHTRPTCAYRYKRTIATVGTLIRHILRARRWHRARLQDGNELAEVRQALDCGIDLPRVKRTDVVARGLSRGAAPRDALPWGVKQGRASTVFITAMACFLSLGDSAKSGSSLKGKSSAHRAHMR